MMYCRTLPFYSKPSTNKSHHSTLSLLPSRCLNSSVDSLKPLMNPYPNLLLLIPIIPLIMGLNSIEVSLLTPLFPRHVLHPSCLLLTLPPKFYPLSINLHLIPGAIPTKRPIMALSGLWRVPVRLLPNNLMTPDSATPLHLGTINLIFHNPFTIAPTNLPFFSFYSLSSISGLLPLATNNSSKPLMTDSH